MRFRIIASSCLLIAVSAGGVKTLAASPDCARWIRDYQQGLSKRAALTKKHVVHAAKRLHVPRPKMLYANAPVHRKRSPKLSPQEMLKRFRVLCGDDLPDEPISVSFVPASLDALLIPPASFSDYGTPLTGVGGPVSFAATPPSGAVTTPDQPITGGTPGLPVIPTPVIPVIPGTPTPVPVTPTPVPVTPSPVPEPGSIILMLTGALGAIPLVRRRLR